MSERREMAQELIGRGVSERLACRSVGIQRSSFRYEAKKADEEKELLGKEVLALAQKHRRYGYRRVTALLRRGGEKVNPKRVYRLWKRHGLTLPRKRPRRRPKSLWLGRPVGALDVNQVWCYDFLFDRTVTGEPIRILAILDEYTRECPALRVLPRVSSDQVKQVLEEVIRRRGKPEFIRSDNGPEFIGEQLKRWLLDQGILPMHTEPGHPWENGFVESFNGKVRDECLNMELFFSCDEAAVVLEWWRKQYNESRPHSALSYKTPEEKRSSTVGGEAVVASSGHDLMDLSGAKN